jgi:hypothetical protein
MTETIMSGEYVSFVREGGIPVTIVKYGGTYVRVTWSGGKQVRYVPYGGTPITVDREANLPEDIQRELGY